MKIVRLGLITLLAWTAVFPLPAHENDKLSNTPCFRPATEQAAEFSQRITSSKIALFPSIYRTVNPAAGEVIQKHTTIALKRIKAFLETNNLGSARISTIQFELSEKPGNNGQFAL